MIKIAYQFILSTMILTELVYDTIIIINKYESVLNLKKNNGLINIASFYVYNKHLSYHLTTNKRFDNNFAPKTNTVFFLI